MSPEDVRAAEAAPAHEQQLDRFAEKYREHVRNLPRPAEPPKPPPGQEKD